jgi:hypothetical protein
LPSAGCANANPIGLRGFGLGAGMVNRFEGVSRDAHHLTGLRDIA